MLQKFVSESGVPDEEEEREEEGTGGEGEGKGAVIIITRGRHDTTYDRGGDATGQGWDPADRSHNAGGPSRRPSRG